MRPGPTVRRGRSLSGNVVVTMIAGAVAPWVGMVQATDIANQDERAWDVRVQGEGTLSASTDTVRVTLDVWVLQLRVVYVCGPWLQGHGTKEGRAHHS